jgi:hypothetical protein
MTPKTPAKETDAGAAGGRNASQPRPDAALPHERDTAPDENGAGPRKEIRQAADDLERGLVDTDRHGERGIDQAVNPANVAETPRSPNDAEKAKKADPASD